MNLVSVVFLTLTLVVVPAAPAYGVGGTPVRPTWTGHDANPVHGGTVRNGAVARAWPAEAAYAPPVDGAGAGVVRGFDPPESRWGAGHRGVDLASVPGAEVRSPGAGTVTFAGRVAGRGVVVVTHADGLRSSLEPVAATVPRGTAVAIGEVVGALEGTPGHCIPDACVHWGVRRGERYLDPLSLLRPARPAIVLLPDG